MTAVNPRRRRDDSSSLERLLAAKEIVVFCGAGGVGKTSVAAAAALGAASQLGGKVLVLTIDPAKRLATALGLDGLGNLWYQSDFYATFGVGVGGGLKVGAGYVARMSPNNARSPVSASPPALPPSVAPPSRLAIMFPRTQHVRRSSG